MNTDSGEMWHFKSHTTFELNGVRVMEIIETKSTWTETDATERARYYIDTNLIGEMSVVDLQRMTNRAWEADVGVMVQAYYDRKRPSNNQDVPETYGTW
jgi:hypothetical protein